MVLLAAARDLHKDVIPSTKSRSGRRPKTSKHTDDLLIRELRKNHQLNASKLKEQPAEGPEHPKSTCCLQTSPNSTYGEEVFPICFELCSREC